MQDLLAAFDERVRPISDPAEALEAFVTLHIEFHTTRKNEVFLATTELRSLDPDNYRKIVKMRNIYEKGLVDLLKRGVDLDVFALEDIRLTAYALIAMLTGVSTWYRPGGKLSQEELLRIYVSLASRMTRANSASGHRKQGVRKVLAISGR
jgi:hypothetical protein